MQNIQLPDLIIRVALGVLAFVAGAWLALGRIVAEKTATALAMPCGLVWLLLLVVVLAARRAGRRDLMLAAVLPFTLLTLLGNGFVAEYLASSLERPYLAIDPLKEEPFEVVIVLGGGTITGGNGRIQGNTSGDRILLAAQLYHAGIGRKLICSGRRIDELDPDRTNPAEESKQLLISLGVQEDAIEIQEGRNTAEEIVLLGRRFGQKGDRVGLVTSAWHLPRAMRLAEHNEFRPSPLPADFITQPQRQLTTGAIVLKCIPQDAAAAVSAKLIKEYLGTLVGR